MPDQPGDTREENGDGQTDGSCFNDDEASHSSRRGLGQDALVTYDQRTERHGLKRQEEDHDGKAHA
jgi:hypothetical protein